MSGSETSHLSRRQFVAATSVAALSQVAGGGAAVATPPTGMTPMYEIEYELKDVLYENPLDQEKCIADFRLEGDACITFPKGRMRMERAYPQDMEQGKHAHFVFWCPKTFPDNIAVTYEFKPLTDLGLSMLWLAGTGKDGQDLFDAALSERSGDYKQYLFGDINALNISYRRRNHKERPFHMTNLRKSQGAHLVAQGADPLPEARDVVDPYKIQAIKAGPHVRFSMNDLVLFEWFDDGKTHGPILTGGKIGIRQMQGLIAEYRNLTVHHVSVAKS